uniref:Uncharacterized protein n=1 Tax=uncultured Desulfobacterium sp. TaxID=201089 RepID=E1YHY8_9BACT|nr:unknown protein [uncultured Desulfobacterium sp.]
MVAKYLFYRKKVGTTASIRPMTKAAIRAPIILTLSSPGTMNHIGRPEHTRSTASPMA